LPHLLEDIPLRERKTLITLADYYITLKASVEHRRDSEDEVRNEIIAAFQMITPDMAYRAT